MKTKDYYIKPTIETIKLEVEENTSVVTTSSGTSVGGSDNETSGTARSKRRNFWDDDKE